MLCDFTGFGQMFSSGGIKLRAEHFVSRRRCQVQNDLNNNYSTAGGETMATHWQRQEGLMSESEFCPVSREPQPLPCV